MADEKLLTVLDALQTYLASSAVTTAYPGLAGLAINLFDEQETQYPLLDIHPTGEDPIFPAAEGALGEMAHGLFEYLLVIQAEQYLTAVREAVNRAGALRRALNCNSAGAALGVNWIKLESMRQAEPDVEKGAAFVNLTGRIRAKYAIEAR
jgi:hypothetical protein